MLAVLGYPFRLAASAPFATLVALAVGSCLLFAVDVLSAAVGLDPIYRWKIDTWRDVLANAAYLLVYFVALASLTAPSMALALQREGLRQNGFRLVDAWLVTLVMLRLVLVYLAPLLALVVAVTFPSAVVVEIAGLSTELAQMASWLTGLAAIAALLFLYVRLWFAPAHSLQDGRFRFFASWRLTRGRFWRVLVYAAVLLILTTLVEWLWEILAFRIPESPPTTGWREAFHPWAFVFLSVSAVVSAGLSLYVGAAQGVAFAKLVPATERAS